MSDAPFTAQTTGCWQALLTPDAVADWQPPWRHSVPVSLPDGRVLRLPIRALPAPAHHGVASLIGNQASLEVIDALGRLLAQQVIAALSAQAVELVVGLPTLGLAFAPIVARELGHSRFVPLGTSRKFWYDDALSAAVQSITSPQPGKRVYLDPNLLPLVQRKRVLLVDDAVSSGSTAGAPWDLLQRVGADVLALGVVMRQGRRWVQTLGPERAARVIGVFDSPLLQAVPDGWVPRE